MAATRTQAGARAVSDGEAEDGACFQAGLADEVASKSGADLGGVKCLPTQVSLGPSTMKRRAI